MRQAVGMAALVFLLALSALCGCYTVPFQDPGPARPFVRASETMALFDYDPEPVRVRFYPRDEVTDQYAVYLLKFRVRDFENLRRDSVRAYWFARRDTSRPAPLLIVMPPTGGPYELSLHFGRYFAERGFACLCLTRRERFFRPENDIAYHHELFRQSVIDIRRGIDWALTQPAVDASRVAVLGVSLGAVLSQLAMQADERIGAGALLLGAQDLPLILETSGFMAVRRYRNMLRERHDLSGEELRRFVEESFAAVDPRSYPGRIDPARLLMVSGRFDNIIQFEVTRRTWENLGRPELHVIPTGHYSAMLLRDLSMGRIHDHFLRTLDIQQTAVRERGGEIHAYEP